MGVAYLFISHDIGVIAHIADRIAVMYHGTLVEEGPANAVLRPPYHPYTELLLSSVPLIGQRRTPPPRIERPAPTGGCKFAARCPRHLGPICDTVPTARPARRTRTLLSSATSRLPVLEVRPALARHHDRCRGGDRPMMHLATIPNLVGRPFGRLAPP